MHRFVCPIRDKGTAAGYRLESTSNRNVAAFPVLSSAFSQLRHLWFLFLRSLNSSQGGISHFSSISHVSRFLSFSGAGFLSPFLYFSGLAFLSGFSVSHSRTFSGLFSQTFLNFLEKFSENIKVTVKDLNRLNNVSFTNRCGQRVLKTR